MPLSSAQFSFIWFYNMDQREILKQNLERAKSRKFNREEFTNEFLKLKRQSATYRTDKIYPTATAERPENTSKNRYKDILPYDHSRVKLSLITSDKDSQYINANFIKGVYEPSAYIATQGPLPTTIVDFWRMIWEYKVLVVVMACMEFEMGKKKCERYWVDVDESPLQLGPFSIFCEAEAKRNEYVIHTLKVKVNDSEIRTVYHFHYKNWPDHDVPSSIDPILQLISEMRSYQAHSNVPVCIHCSAGCGRTGVICAIDYTWTLLKDGILPMNFNIFNLIQEMRTQRPLIVQTQEQYKLVYDAVIELFKRQIEVLSNHSNTVVMETQANHPTAEMLQAQHMEMFSLKPLDSSVQEEQKKSQHSDHDTQRLDTNGYRDGAFPVRQAISVGVLNSNSRRNMDTAVNWNSCLARQPLHKHHSLDFNNAFWTELPPTLKSGGETGISLDTKIPLTRTKSTPFELVSQKTSETTTKDSVSCLGLKSGGFQAHSSTSNKLSNNTQCCVHRKLHRQRYIWSSEDPYFSSSSDDPCSPELPDSAVGLPETVPTFFSAVDSKAQTLDSTRPNKLLCSPQVQNTQSLDAVRSACQISSPMDEDIPPPLPERTPESFIIPGEDDVSLLAVSNHQSPEFQVEKPEITKDWSSTSQLKLSDDSVILRPSKSVKVPRPKSVAFIASVITEYHQERSPSPPPLPERTPESFILADEESLPAVLNNAVSLQDSGIKSTDKSLKEGRGFRRSKSLKILRNVKNSICAPSSLVKPSEPGQSNHPSSLFGFANRFSKPKGPRDPPPNWDI
ncbi:tyrosine-protein phosphatase non-receptor type 22 isoform X2 [Hemicordylus capensis]|uniref:tyrosine-protein phosphatase non-receptor type 22 isoform X2 n=1 Tax=Hemicordylus capensis TaxID=884348 RepID=UPI0023033EEB|nr:tyrosine-protein phosphatase non-receptor type 22 isoform X2 [Hemicordylus capensis]